MSPRPFLPVCPALFCGIWLSLPARAADEPPSSAAESQGVRPITQREFADAATANVGFLSELRAWRNTLRGSGARRQWELSALGGDKLALSLGQVAPGALGGGAGVAAKWRGLEIGSTAQPHAVDEALARFDSLLAGERVKAQNSTELHWLRAQLLTSPSAQIEVMAARASRDLDSVSNWRAGEFGSAQVKFRLPASWSLSGDFSRADVERGRENEVASAWGLAAAGPLAHPFGVASARASWRRVGEGYVAPLAENGALGGQNGEVELAQDLKIGALSGHLRFGAATQKREAGEAARAGEQLGQERAASAAQMRLALTPNLSLTGNGQWNSLAATRALRDESGAPPTDSAGASDLLGAGETLSPAQSRELSRALAGDVGVQWNFSKALSLGVSMGASSQNSQTEIGPISNLGPQSEELRRALELRQKRGENDFRLRFSQRARKAVASTSPTASNNAPVSQWRIEAARPLLGQVRLKTILDYASDPATDQSAHRIEAQLQLARAARLDARYREGNLALGLMSDEWSSVFAGSSGASKQWSARFGAGSAASGVGLGLVLELVRNQGASPDSYRVGVQFK